MDNNCFDDIFGNYINPINVNDAGQYYTYTDSGNYSNILPIALKVASKTMAADLVGINPYYNKGIVSYDLARMLYDCCHYTEPTDYYFIDDYSGYSIRSVYPDQSKCINNYHEYEENWIGVNDVYAAPYFKDVLTWLSKDNNYAKYSSKIFRVKNYLYNNDDKEDFQPMSAPTGQLFYMDTLAGI